MINIVGAGLAGLSAAITLAKDGKKCSLISKQPSERAQSVLAEGGINAALDTMGEHDTPQEHFEDTMRGGCYLADEEAVRGLTENAPEILNWLLGLGAGLNMQGDKPLLRNFGGQKKKRTAFAKSSTGKIIMTALIDEARKYEVLGLITRYPHHELIGLQVRGETCYGCVIHDEYTDKNICLEGAVILASGGLNGFFDGLTTGTAQNDGSASVLAFEKGAEAANLEFIQFHPTTIAISGKRMLITEAARGEGGRLYALLNGEKSYFMEEKYPELGNLMPRDVVSRESYLISQRAECSGVFLDMSELKKEVWQHKLSDLRNECIHYLALDPQKEPIPVEPGIHYFMGGLKVDKNHQTSIKNLFAAGECAAQYHGANRLGGNSMLGAIYGGQTAAKNAPTDIKAVIDETAADGDDIYLEPNREAQMREALVYGLGIVRGAPRLEKALEMLRGIEGYGKNARLWFAEAMLLSALYRRESRGAHCRSDYPNRSENFQRPTTARLTGGNSRYNERTVEIN